VHGVNIAIQSRSRWSLKTTIRDAKFGNYAAFLAMPIRLRLDHDDAGKEPAGRYSQVARIGIVLMAKDP
jgi:hypothetical protein